MRRRGTAIVIRDDRVLLVRDQNKSKYSLPGGKANKNEPTIAAAIRELYEECRMTAVSAQRIPECDYQGSVNQHEISILRTTDDVVLNQKELVDYIWWDMDEDIPRYPHVDTIVSTYLKSTAHSNKHPLFPAVGYRDNLVFVFDLND
jgi:8-oxo-dGTP diphosphatase